jgi:hypothetical protein
MLSRQPQWRKYARTDDHPDCEGMGRLLVQIPCPNEAAGNLVISTDDDEVTVDWGYFHQHFDREDDTDQEVEFDEALRTVEAIMSEELWVAAWRANETWMGSQPLMKGEELDPFFSPHAPDELIIRSWNGTYDTVEQLLSPSERIAKVLSEEWNPLGIQNRRKARRRYMMYAEEIQDLLRNRVPIRKLVTELYKMQTGRMRLEGKTDDCERIAKRLLDLLGKEIIVP